MEEPIVVATLDLENLTHRQIHAAIERLHSGRHPLWKMLALRRDSSALVELAACRGTKSVPFSVVTWQLDELAVSWRDFASREEAERCFRELETPYSTRAAHELAGRVA